MLLWSFLGKTWPVGAPVHPFKLQTLQLPRSPGSSFQACCGRGATDGDSCDGGGYLRVSEIQNNGGGGLVLKPHR